MQTDNSVEERTYTEREIYEQVVHEGTFRPFLKRRWKSVAPIIAVVTALVFRAEGLLLLLFKAKWLLATAKFTNIFLTGGSMLLSIGLYAVAYGLNFAVGLVLLILVHELGHVVMLRRNGIKASPPLFIPFFGAFVAMKEIPRDARVEAEVALGGPVLGTIGAALAFILYRLTGYGLFAVLAYVGFLLNLFNLIPMTPLDGGRAAAAISRYLWLVGAVLLVAVFIVTRDPFLLIVLLFAGGQMFVAWRHTGLAKDYYSITNAARIGISVVYFGLVTVLGVSMASVGPYISRAHGTF